MGPQSYCTPLYQIPGVGKGALEGWGCGVAGKARTQMAPAVVWNAVEELPYPAANVSNNEGLPCHPNLTKT